jgi:nucleotide-binding universal stress UspA family protein
VRGEEAGSALNEIVLGVGPDQAEAPLRFAFASAAALGATVSAVRAWEPATAYSGYYHILDIPKAQAQEAEDLAAQLKAVRDEYPDVAVTEQVIRGNPVTVLMDASRGSRMLVVGSHRRRSVLSPGTGYVAHGLIAHSPTPIAVVPIG